MPVVGTATDVVLATVMPWLTKSDEFVPVIGSTTPLLAEAGTNATPCDVNDGSCGVVTAAYETPAVAAKSAALATSMAGDGRRRSLRMDVLLGAVGLVLVQDAPRPRLFRCAAAGQLFLSAPSSRARARSRPRPITPARQGRPRIRADHRPHRSPAAADGSPHVRAHAVMLDRGGRRLSTASTLHARV